ncbi:breast cancer type 1 susceptibility protein [Echinococcus multilocularis]|uniref:Breast cancer type 1 susceptibility protein n=1 Tax=Echinococcus multilocularis TaxID=6211 RepID=A0A068YIB5_ECHMU|nr:breast cancer type 1 susceptibility protein [Echinococcus multilocularis]
MTKRISRRDQPRTSKRMAIALGTSARILKHHMRSKEGTSVLNSDELTQPMRVQPTEEALSCELFAMTQTPPLIEPSVMRLDEFPDLSNKRNRAQSADVSGVSMRRPPRDGEDEANCSHRGSKLSLASAFKRSSFLRSLSRGRKRQNQSQSSESSASLKYRIPPVSSKPRTSLPPTSANVFSPAWSRLKSLGTEFGRQSKTQLLIRSMKKCSSSRVAFKPVETAVQPPNLGPVCRFILPSRGPWFEGSKKGKTAALLCSRCGSEIIFISNPATVLTSPMPYPVVRDSRAYWPELWQQSPQVITGQGDVSVAVTSAVTTLPSYVPPISLNSRQPCDPARCEETNQLQIPMTPEKGTPSTINIQPSLVPQSFSLNTPSSKLSCEEQAEAAKLDTPPSPQTVSSSDTSSLPATVIKSVDIQPTPTLPAANPIIPETPLQAMATGSQERDEQQQNRGYLEAVSRLEQQLLEESLNAELLANPGTEPTEESEAEVISPSSLRESSTITTPAVCPAPVSSGLSPVHGLNETSDHPSSTDKITREMTKLDMIPDSNALEEGLDVIPSSQNEEETKEGEIQVRSDEPMDAMATPQTEAISVPLIRVESSQPVTAATFEALPLSQTPSCASAADTIPFTQPRLLSTSLIADTENVNPRSREDESTQPTIFITGSNLSPIEVNALRRFCRQFNAVEMSSFESNRTTHVVMATQVTRPRVAQRTLKYFMGILNGAWVVNTHWVRKCLLAATLLPEEPFEVQGDTMCGDCHEGPRRGRLRVSAIPPSLGTSNRPAASVSCPDQRRPFAGLMLCPFGDISPLNPKDFEALVIAGGGIPIADPSLFPSEVVSTTTTTTGATEINPKCLIFTCPTAPKFQKQDCIDIYNKYQIPVFNLNWMLNCASVYRRLPMSKVYYIHPTE